MKRSEVEKKQWEALAARDLTAWEEALTLVSAPDTKVRVCTVIWWDFYADRFTMEELESERFPVRTMWPHDIPATTLQRGLLTVGYPTRAAAKRALATDGRKGKKATT